MYLKTLIVSETEIRKDKYIKISKLLPNFSVLRKNLEAGYKQKNNRTYIFPAFIFLQE